MRGKIVVICPTLQGPLLRHFNTTGNFVMGCMRTLPVVQRRTFRLSSPPWRRRCRIDDRDFSLACFHIVMPGTSPA
jgi:hypothetical protein